MGNKHSNIPKPTPFERYFAILPKIEQRVDTADVHKCRIDPVYAVLRIMSYLDVFMLPDDKKTYDELINILRQYAKDHPETVKYVNGVITKRFCCHSH